MGNGKFISIEGGEGVGKTTLINALKSLAERDDREILFTREPGGTPRAEELRNILLNTNASEDAMSVATEALVINAARSDHVDNFIRPALKRGALVVCDRYADSTRAYQGGKLDDALLESVIRLATGGLEPDLTILLDGDPAVLVSRRVARGDVSDRFEQRDIEFHNGVREAFLKTQERFPERIQIVDATDTQENVLTSVLSLMQERLGFTFGETAA